MLASSLWNSRLRSSSLYRIAALIILASMIPAASMWSDRLEISAKIKTAQSNIHITSYKAMGFGENRNGRCLAIEGHVTLSMDGKKAITVFTNITLGWHGWIGLVISNDGSFPKDVSRPSIAIPINFTSRVFLYGPYRSPGNTPIWGSVDICAMTDNLRGTGNPFPGENSRSSVYLEPGYKAISWIFINYTGVESVSRLDISISIS